MKKSLAPAPSIEPAVWNFRGQHVMLDSDLARLYGVETKRLNEAVQRNIERFPDDFMFRLTTEELAIFRSQFVTQNEEATEKYELSDLRSQIATLKKGRGQHLKYLPYAFTEQGVAMLSSVLRSSRAVAVNIEIMRAFVRMRKIGHSHELLKKDVQALKRRSKEHDEKIGAIFLMIDEMSAPKPLPKKRKIGFLRDNE